MISALRQKKQRTVAIALALALIAVISITASIYTFKNASAAPVVGFNAGRIIDDGVFTNKSSMSANDIQQFLNGKVPVCDTLGQQTNEFDSTGRTRAKYALDTWGKSPPFTCLKDFNEGGKSSAQIIYDISQEFSINPQVLIVLLQKEQSLITDTWPIPDSSQYRTATGYGCPDTAPCNTEYYGLTNQLRWSARMFRSIMNNSPGWYTPYILGSNYIRFSPNAACGGSNITIENRATQALYNYTPYQPNQGALNAGWGSAPCGAYGNRNFYLYFTNWFGSTTGPDYSGNIDSVTLYSDPGYTSVINKIGNKYILQPSQTVYARVGATNTGRASWNNLTNLGTSGPYDRTSQFKAPSWINAQRAATVASTPVAPYASSTFSFALVAPANPGIFGESFNIVQDGIAWTSASTRIDIQVATPATAPTGYTDNILPVNGSLLNNRSILSSDGYTALTISQSGTLELRHDYQTVWSAPTSAGAGAHLVVQNDGNLVLYKKSGEVAWHSGTNGNGEVKLHVQEDGNLVLYKVSNGSPVWYTGTSIGANHHLFPTPAIGSNGVLVAGQATRSIDRKYSLHLQPDGNLVLYSPTKAIWASNTAGSKATRLIMQTDGNLVLYDEQSRAVWFSGTAGHGQSSLNIQTDGNLVVYSASRATWASNTSGRQ